MIKINLANTLVADSGSSVGRSSSGGMSEQLQDVSKVLLILLPLGLLYFFEQSQLGIKQSALTQVQQESTQIDQKISALADVETTIAKIKEDKAELGEKFEVIKKIFGLRALKLKTISAIQREIDPKSWITNIKFKDKQVTVVGYSPEFQLTQDYINKLATMRDIFTSVENKSINKEIFDDSTIYKFEIAIGLRN